MQKSGHKRRVIHLLPSKDHSDGNGVCEVWLARMTELPLVHFSTKGKSIAQQRFIRAGVIGADQCDQIVCCRLGHKVPRL